jgi:membrane associated rhomboid family serine protease
MDDRRVTQESDKHTVPGTGGPGPDEASAEGQGALRLHAGTAAIAVVLSVFVTWIFVRLGSMPLAAAFGSVAAISLVILGWALYRKRRSDRKRSDSI